MNAMLPTKQSIGTRWSQGTCWYLCVGTIVTTLLGNAAAGTDDALTEIVVTAQRRSETIQDIPIAVTAITGDDLIQRGVRTAAEIVSSVPNMTLSTPFGPEGMPVFAIRGVSESDYTQHQASPIAMYVDEIYKSVGAVQAQQTFDLDRVEVLRGPQGTLYGKNATGGAVNFYSKDPSLSVYDGYVTLGLGNYNDNSVRAAVGGPIVDDTLGWRAAIYYEKRDGWDRSTIPGVAPFEGVDVIAGRLTALWKLSDNLTAKLKLSASDADGSPYANREHNVDPTIYGCTCITSWFETQTKFNIPERLRNDSVSLKIDWAISNYYSVTSITGFDYGYWYTITDDGALGYNFQGVPIHIADPDTYLSSVNEFSQELRITSHGLETFEWLGGLYYGRDSVHLFEQGQFSDSYPGSFVLSPGKTSYGYNELANFDQIRDTHAIFLNATDGVSAAVRLHAGIRYTQDKITIDNYYAMLGALAAPPVGLGPNDGQTYWSQTIPVLPTSLTTFLPSIAPQSAPTPPFGQTNKNVSGNIGADWKPVDGLLAYATISQGYRGAAFNGQAYISPAELTFAAPETLRDYEIGLKSEFWEKRVELNTAIFYYDYRNMQFLDTFYTPSGIIGIRLTNAPKAKITGGEVELRLKPVLDLEVRGGIGLEDARFVSLTLDGVNLDGHKIFQAPDVSANVAIDWTFAHFPNGNLLFHIDGNYYSKQYYDPNNHEQAAQKPYGLINARLSFQTLQARGFSTGIWVRNLADREYETYGLYGPGLDQALAGEPRTYGADISYRF